MSDPVSRLNAALERRYAIECGLGMAVLIVGLQFWPSTASAQTPPQEAVDSLNTPVWIAGGTFSMGSDDGDTLEQPVHQVTVSGFWIQQHEVTNEEYRRLVPEQRFPDGEERHPVYASWHEAMNYAESRGGTLPTEAQWEFAARGTEGRTYAWGDEDPTCERAQIGGCGGRTIPVMSRPDGTTPEGVHDLTGNVWEWVHDWVGDYGAAAETDRVAPPLRSGV